jgi:haloalkane dehalogenase
MGEGMAVAERPAWVDDELFPFESRFIDIDGHSIHYVDEGSGPALLFLHGNPTWSFDYSKVIESLRQEFRCIVLRHVRLVRVLRTGRVCACN